MFCPCLGCKPLAEATVEVAEVPQVEELPEAEVPITEPEPTVTLAWRNDERSVLQSILALCESIGIIDLHFFYGQGLRIRQMDPSRVCMVDARISFGQTQLGDEEISRHFVLNLKALKRAMRLSEPLVTVNATEAIVRGNIGDSSLIAEVTVPLLEEEADEIPEPKIAHNISAKVDFDLIQKAVAAMVKAPEALRFRSFRKKLTISGANDEQQVLSVEGNSAKGKGNALYAWSYLDALKGEWKIAFKTDLPMHLSRKELAGTGDEKYEAASVHIWLAPRIEVD